MSSEDLQDELDRQELQAALDGASSDEERAATLDSRWNLI